MDAKTDGWEHYTDDTGRRHWRWPASDVRDVRIGAAGRQRNVDWPEPARARDVLTQNRDN
jgi:hypothetical protein